MASWTFAKTVPALRADYDAVAGYCEESMNPTTDSDVQRRLGFLHTQFGALSESDKTSEDGKQLKADIDALSDKYKVKEEKATTGGAGKGRRKSRKSRKRRNQTRRNASKMRKS